VRIVPWRGEAREEEEDGVRTGGIERERTAKSEEGIERDSKKRQRGDGRTNGEKWRMRRRGKDKRDCGRRKIDKQERERERDKQAGREDGGTRPEPVKEHYASPSASPSYPP
jgi:hypothetical protein